MSIFENKTECKERGDMVVSPACVPVDTSRLVRTSKPDPFAPNNSVEHADRPRYGHDY